MPTVAAGTDNPLRHSDYGVLVATPGSRGVRMVQASAHGVAASQALTEGIDAVCVSLQRSARVDDFGPPLHAPPGHTRSLAALGALLVFSAGAFSMALQVIAGTIGIGSTIA